MGPDVVEISEKKPLSIFSFTIQPYLIHRRYHFNSFLEHLCFSATFRSPICLTGMSFFCFMCQNYAFQIIYLYSRKIDTFSLERMCLITLKMVAS